MRFTETDPVSGGVAPSSRSRLRVDGWNPVQAQNRGVYPLGMSATNSGVTPPSGFTYSNQLLFYSRSQAKDDNGNTMPVAGNNSVIMDMNTLTWVSRKNPGSPILRGSDSPFRKERSDIRYTGQHQWRQWLCGFILYALYSGLERGTRRGSRDVWIPGADRPVLRWGERQCRFRLLDECSVSGTDVLSDWEQTLVSSAFELYEFHTTQEETDVHPGQTFDLDYSL